MRVKLRVSTLPMYTVSRCAIRLELDPIALPTAHRHPWLPQGLYKDMKGHTGKNELLIRVLLLPLVHSPLVRLDLRLLPTLARRIHHILLRHEVPIRLEVMFNLFRIRRAERFKLDTAILENLEHLLEPLSRPQSPIIRVRDVFDILLHLELFDPLPRHAELPEKTRHDDGPFGGGGRFGSAGEYHIGSVALAFGDPELPEGAAVDAVFGETGAEALFDSLDGRLVVVCESVGCIVWAAYLLAMGQRV